MYLNFYAYCWEQHAKLPRKIFQETINFGENREKNRPSRRRCNPAITDTLQPHMTSHSPWLTSTFVGLNITSHRARYMSFVPHKFDIRSGYKWIFDCPGYSVSSIHQQIGNFPPWQLDRMPICQPRHNVCVELTIFWGKRAKIINECAYFRN